ncbi:hypothetical protein Taro_049716 [Colocasia esculenta]|uniref:Uncharacterized protein n=1 Tax=Colocasia esculenta TaxID=4460 RepID=A0A843XBS9_COLES|nr:hypothetical protein [Colocasia esculenta]
MAETAAELGWTAKGLASTSFCYDGGASSSYLTPVSAITREVLSLALSLSLSASHGGDLSSPNPRRPARPPIGFVMENEKLYTRAQVQFDPIRVYQRRRKNYGPKHIEVTLARAKFEELCGDLLDRLKNPVNNALKDAKLSFKDLNEVILVGGSTRIPVVQELVRKMTGKEPNVTVNPDEIVALGEKGNLWRELWEIAKPLPAAKQAPLFDEDLAV